MWLYNQRVIYICICLCSDNCFRTDQTRLGYYDVTARLTLMIDLLSLLFINDLKDWFVSANYILWFTVGCRWSLFEIWRIECKQKGSKLNCYLVPPYISVKFDWGLGVSVVCTALRSDSDPCFIWMDFKSIIIVSSSECMLIQMLHILVLSWRYRHYCSRSG